MLTPIYDADGNLNKKLFKKLSNKKLALFLDYDGTLTPIVRHPDLAVLSRDRRAVLKKLAAVFPVAIISGRLLKDIKSKIKLTNIFYAGNHGLELAGPSIHESFALAYCREINRINQQLKESIGNIPNILLENKKFSLSVHFRLVEISLIPEIGKTIDSVLKEHPNFNRRRGKKVIEIYPDIGWDKGSAVLWFLNYMRLTEIDILPIYLGDDATDEDAFKGLRRKGVSILVTKHERPTMAEYSLKNTDEVYKFLNDILRLV